MNNYTNLAFHLLDAAYYTKKASTGANPNDLLPGIPGQTYDPSTIGYANIPDALKTAQPELASKLLGDRIRGTVVGGATGGLRGIAITPVLAIAASLAAKKLKMFKGLQSLSLPDVLNSVKSPYAAGIGAVGGVIGGRSGAINRQTDTINAHNQQALDQVPGYYKQFLNGPTIEKLPPYLQSLIGTVPKNPETAMSVAELLQKNIPEGRDAENMKLRTRALLQRLSPRSFE